MKEYEIVKKINDICKKYEKKDYPGIAIAVIKGGKVILKRGYGIANLDYDIPIDENTVFHVCSISKQFTAFCIALLLEEEKLDLNQKVTDFFPEIKNIADGVTVHDLVYMTNGIPDVYDTELFIYGKREDEYVSIEEFWKCINSFNEKLFTPGKQWSYGNTGYFLLGQIVQKITNKTLSEYADENIFKPLGMNHTFIRDDYTKIIKNRAMGYSNYEYIHEKDKHKKYVSRNDKLSINQENMEIGGAGQLWTTIDDFILWDKNLNKNILGKNPNELLRFILSSGHLNNGEKCGYGLGLFIDDFYGRKIIHHGGCAGGYSAYYTKLLKENSSVIVFGNHTDFTKDFGYQDKGITEEILKLLI